MTATEMRDRPAIVICHIVAIALISLDATPLMSLATLGGGNAAQYGMLLLLCCAIYAYHFHIRTPPLALVILLVLGLHELCLGIAAGESLALPVRIILVALGVSLLLSLNYSTENFAKIFYRFTDVLVVITIVGISIAMINFDGFKHAPLPFADEAIFRKIAVAGKQIVFSIGYINFLQPGEPIFPVISDTIAPTGVSSEPHIFFTLIFLGALWRIWTLGARQNPVLVLAYVFVLLATASTVNIIAATTAVAGGTLFLVPSAHFKRLLASIGIICLLLTAIAANLFGAELLELQRNAAGTATFLPEDFSNRSGLQTAYSLIRVFVPAFDWGLITAGPSMLNKYQAPGISVVGVALYWSYVAVTIIFPAFSDTNRAGGTFCITILLYCLVYSMKDAGSLIFMPDVSCSMIFASTFLISARNPQGHTVAEGPTPSMSINPSAP